jgi:pimeloyl-ACP methyl ester carboxylesterase
MLIAVNDIELWVEDHPAAVVAADATPVLLLSGSDATTLRWPESLLEALTGAGHRVVAFDPRDCGASTKIDPDQPYQLDAMAADAVGVLDALGIAQAHVVGYSMGGAIAQVLALEVPERVRTLTLVATTPGLGDERLPFAADWFVERMAERLFAAPPRTDHDRIEWIVDLYRLLAGTRRPFDETGQRALAAAELARCWYPESGHGLAVGASPSRLDRLGEIRVPTLVVHGTADPVFAIEHGRALAEGIPDARFFTIDDLGHELPARELVGVLLAHLAAHET